MTAAGPVLQVLVASTRPGRVGEPRRPRQLQAPIPFVTQFIEGEGDEHRFVPNVEVDTGMTDLLDVLSDQLNWTTRRSS